MDFLTSLLVSMCLVSALGIAVIGPMLRWKAVKEGTAVAFELFGEFIYCAMTLEGYGFDENIFIVEGRNEKTYRKNNRGNWCVWRICNVVFYLRPFITAAKYEDHNDPKDGFGKDDTILLHDLQKDFVNTTAETKTPADGSGATVALTPKGFFRMMPVGLYQFLYRTPNNVVADVIKMMESVMQGYIRRHTPNEIQDAKDAPESIWDDIMANPQSCHDIKEILERRWGVKIIPESIRIYDIGYSKEYQKRLEERSSQRLSGEAFVEEINTITEGLAASNLGMTLEGLRAKITADPNFVDSDKYKKALADAQDMARRKHAAENGELADWRIGGTRGEKYDGNFLLVSGRGGVGGQGKQDKGSGSGQSGKRTKKDVKDMTEEEKQEAWRKFTGGQGNPS